MTKAVDIEKWVKKNRNSNPVFGGWDRKLWTKPYDEIVEYIKERFNNTLFETEYYFCMLYLYKHVDKEALYVPFRESPQYLRMLSETQKGITIATTPKGVKETTISVKIQPFCVKMTGV